MKSESTSNNSLSKIFHSLPQLERYFEVQHAVNFVAYFCKICKILEICFKDVFVERCVACSH